MKELFANPHGNAQPSPGDDVAIGLAQSVLQRRIPIKKLQQLVAPRLLALPVLWCTFCRIATSACMYVWYLQVLGLSSLLLGCQW